MQADLRRQAQDFGLQRQRQLGVEGEAPALHLRGMAEIHVLAAEVEIEAQRQVAAAGIDRDLRQPAIGLDHRWQGRVLQRLVALGQHVGGPPAAAVAEGTLAQQVGLRDGGGAAAEIAEVGAVGRIVQ